MFNLLNTRRSRLVAVFVTMIVASVSVASYPYLVNVSENRHRDTILQASIFDVTKSAVEIQDDSKLLVNGKLTDPFWMTAVVVGEGEKHKLLPMGSVVFTCEDGADATLNKRFSWLSLQVKGSGRGIWFADGSLFLSGNLECYAKGFGRICAESDVHVDARDCGPMLARAGATFREFSTKAEYAAYRKQVVDLEQRVVCGKGDLSGIDVSDAAGVKLDGKALDSRWLQTVNIQSCCRDMKLHLGELVFFTCEPRADVAIELIGGLQDQKRKLHVKGAGKGLVFPDGTVWLVNQASYKSEYLPRIAMSAGVTAQVTGGSDTQVIVINN